MEDRHEKTRSVMLCKPEGRRTYLGFPHHFAVRANPDLEEVFPSAHEREGEGERKSAGCRCMPFGRGRREEKKSRREIGYTSP